jgi:hypothetical protein
VDKAAIYLEYMVFLFAADWCGAAVQRLLTVRALPGIGWMNFFVRQFTRCFFSTETQPRVVSIRLVDKGQIVAGV